jgi:hypothetical protein
MWDIISQHKFPDFCEADRATKVRPRADAKHFPSILCVYTSCKVHPASYPMGTGGCLPGVKRGRGDILYNYGQVLKG